MKELNWQEIDRIIEAGLAEDIGDGDVTTNTIIARDHHSSAFMKVKSSGVIAGIPIAERVFRRLQQELEWNPLVKDGDSVTPGEVIVDFSGSTRALLTGERLALNILQRLSGIATMSRAYSAAVNGYQTRILDTRKTLPGLRAMEKYAVAAGGSSNHRFGLFDLIMIKDNHIKIGGGIRAAVEKARAGNSAGLKIEVETSNLDEVQQALEAGADIIMLDNMSNQMMAEAVRLIDGRSRTEASGGITLERIPSICATGVDLISVGALTHSVMALDIGMYFKSGE